MYCPTVPVMLHNGTRSYCSRCGLHLCSTHANTLGNTIIAHSLGWHTPIHTCLGSTHQLDAGCDSLEPWAWVAHPASHRRNTIQRHQQPLCCIVRSTSWGAQQLIHWHTADIRFQHSRPYLGLVLANVAAVMNNSDDSRAPANQVNKQHGQQTTHPITVQEASVGMKQPGIGLCTILTVSTECMPLRMLASATPAVDVSRLSGHQHITSLSNAAAAYGTRHWHGQRKQKPGMPCATIHHTIPYTCMTLQDGTCSNKEATLGTMLLQQQQHKRGHTCGSHDTWPVSLL